MTKKLTDILQEFSHIQAILINVFKKKFSIAGNLDDFDVLSQIEQRGNIEIKGDNWAFKRHGLGIQFIRIHDLLNIDAHIYAGTWPNGFDAWRILLFLESQNTKSFLFEEKKQPVKEQNIDHCLKILENRHLVEQVADNFYTLQSVEFREHDI